MQHIVEIFSLFLFHKTFIAYLTVNRTEVLRQFQVAWFIKAEIHSQTSVVRAPFVAKKFVSKPLPLPYVIHFTSNTARFIHGDYDYMGITIHTAKRVGCCTETVDMTYM